MRVFKLTSGGGGKLEARSVMCQMDHHAEVWRVEWNITGTILASSGDDVREIFVTFLFCFVLFVQLF